MGKRIDAVRAATIQKLERWSWPGNVSELENLVERSVILTNGNTLAVSLPKKMNSAIDAAEVVGNFEEQERIVNTLKETKGRVSGANGAAFRLGVKRSTLLDRMKRLGLMHERCEAISCIHTEPRIEESQSAIGGAMKTDRW